MSRSIHIFITRFFVERQNERENPTRREGDANEKKNGDEAVEGAEIAKALVASATHNKKNSMCWFMLIQQSILPDLYIGMRIAILSGMVARPHDSKTL